MQVILTSTGVLGHAKDVTSSCQHVSKGMIHMGGYWLRLQITLDQHGMVLCLEKPPLPLRIPCLPGLLPAGSALFTRRWLASVSGHTKRDAEYYKTWLALMGLALYYAPRFVMHGAWFQHSHVAMASETDLYYLIQKNHNKKNQAKMLHLDLHFSFYIWIYQRFRHVCWTSDIFIYFLKNRKLKSEIELYSLPKLGL